MMAPDAGMVAPAAMPVLGAGVQVQGGQEKDLNALPCWKEKVQEIETASDFKTQHLPLARIKKIMKSDEDVRMISAEAPVLFAKACELFILEITHRAWNLTEDGKRRTLQREDVAAAIGSTDIFDFLVDVVPAKQVRKPTTQGKAAAPSVAPMEMHQLPPGMSIPPARMPGTLPLYPAVPGTLGVVPMPPFAAPVQRPPFAVPGQLPPKPGAQPWFGAPGGAPPVQGLPTMPPAMPDPSMVPAAMPDPSMVPAAIPDPSMVPPAMPGAAAVPSAMPDPTVPPAKKNKTE